MGRERVFASRYGVVKVLAARGGAVVTELIYYETGRDVKRDGSAAVHGREHAMGMNAGGAGESGSGVVVALTTAPTPHDEPDDV